MLAMQREMEMLASKMLLDWPEASVALANLKMKVVHIECVEGDSGSHEGRRRVCSDLALGVNSPVSLGLVGKLPTFILGGYRN